MTIVNRPLARTPKLLPWLVAVPALASSLAAQQVSRAWVEVSPAGVFERSATAGSARSAANPAGGFLALSAAGLRWTYPNPAGLPWISESASVGNFGTFAWLGQNLNAQRLSFVSSTDDAGSPPIPIYEPLFPGATLAVRAADKSATTVVGEIAGTTYNLHYFSGFASTPVHTIAQPSGFEIAIADGGARFSSGYTNASGASQVDVYDATSGTPTVPIQSLTATSFAFRHHDISGDGSTVLLASGTTNHVFDVASGVEIFTDPSTVSHDAHAINFDGSAWGRGGFDIRAWVHDGVTYNQVLSFVDGSLGFGVSTACDISGDGSTFAAASYDANDANKFRVYVWSLSATGSTLLWTYSHTGSGSFQDVPAAVSVSDDGRWIAVGSWGTQSAGHPEAMLFDRDAGSVPVAVVDTPGSVRDLDLSGDGRFLVFGTKAVHAGTFGNGGEGYSFDRGGQGHSLSGTSSVGRTIQLRTYGPSGDFVAHALASALLAAPFPLPGFAGALELDPGALLGSPFAVGTIGPGGDVAQTIPVPTDVTLIGLTVFSQSVRVGSNAFDNHLRLPLTP
jgi:hypothetical protein